MSDVLERLRKIEERLAFLESVISKTSPEYDKESTSSVNVDDLLSLPSSLQKTLVTIEELKEATASDVAEITERSRSVETIYLNQLDRMGLLTRQRKGHRVYFKVLKYY